MNLLIRSMRSTGVPRARRPAPPRPLRASLSLLASLLLTFLCAAPWLTAHAAPIIALDHQLLVNPGAEDGAASVDGKEVVPIPGWSGPGNFTVDLYGGISIPLPESGRIGGGNHFFSGGPNNAYSTVSQRVDVGPLAADIQTGQVTVILSGFMTAYKRESDYGTIVMGQRDASGGAVLTNYVTLGPQEGNYGEWVYYRATQAVPKTTRYIDVQINAHRLLGVFNDAYFDNLSLVLTKTLPRAPTPVADPTRAFRPNILNPNPNAEDGPVSPSGNDIVAIPGWTTTGAFTVTAYGGPSAPTVAQGAAVAGQNALFTGGAGDKPSSATQTVDLSAFAAEADTDKLDIRLYCALGAAGEGSQSARVLLEELDANDQVLLTLDPPSQLGSSNGMTAYLWEAPVVKGMRKARITLLATPEPGAAHNDAFFDNVQLRLIDTIPLPNGGSTYYAPPLTYGANLLTDPGAEDATPQFDTYGNVVPIPGWATTGNFSAVHAYSPGFGSSPEMERIGGGQAFFSGGNSAPISTASQTVDVNSLSQAIDEGGVNAHLEGQLSGWITQGDYGRVLARFLDYTSTPIGEPLFIGPVAGGAPNGLKFRFVQNDAAVPPGTRFIETLMVARRTNGVYIDANFDNLSLSLHPVTTPALLYGDVDGDGSVAVADVILLLRYAVHLGPLTAEQVARADINHDGVASFLDAPLILRRLVGLPWNN